MPQRHPDPSRLAATALWLISDARNDAALERALRRLPRGSGLIYRHYHLPGPQRTARLAALARIARQCGHWLALAGDAAAARRRGAAAAYGPPALLARGPALPRLVTAHSLREIGRANCGRADAILLSPIFPTRSHPGSAVIGGLRFRLLAARALVPVIALGGMDAARAARIGAARWAAIDGLSDKTTRLFSKDS